ncbi:hypothetical protein D3C84_1051420 [compost metagenome]
MGHLLGGPYQCVSNARFGSGVAGIANYLQFTVWPGLVQFPGVIQRTDHVIATMYDHARQMGDLAHVSNQLVRFEEGVVREVVTFDARNG